MTAISRAAGLAAATLLIVVGPGVSAETVTYKGYGNTLQSTENVIELGDDRNLVMEVSRNIATIAPSPTGFLLGDCFGIGVHGGADDFSADFYCRFRESDADSLILKGTEGPAGTTVEVIGGTGKWKGATGTGKAVPRDPDNPLSANDYELTVTTP